MEKVKSYSNHLLFSLTLSSALFLAAPAMGQAYSSIYPAPGTAKSEIYHITKTLNNKLLTSGVMSGQAPASNSSFPEYKDWRLVQTGLDGSVISQRIFSTPHDDRAFESVRTTLGDMMIVGHTGQGFTPADRQELGLLPTDLNASPLIVKMTPGGVATFQFNYEMGGTDDHAFSVVRENNNSYMVLGRSFRTPQNKYVMTLMNVDLNGNVISAHLLNDNFRSNFFPRKMIRTINGGFLIAAVREPIDNHLLHAPDPVDATILGEEIALIKLDVNRQPVFAVLVRPQDANGIGIKDMVEDNLGNVTFVGSSVSGDYIMTIDLAGVITQAKRFSVLASDMDWEPKSIDGISNGFAISGSVDVGPGVPRIELDPSLVLTDAKRHQFGENINSIGNMAGGIQFLAGNTPDDALVVRWLLGQPNLTCNMQDEQVTMGPFPFESKKYDILPESISVSRTSVSIMSSPAANRVNNCLLPPAAKMGAASATPSAEAAVSISPNPARDQLQLFVPGEEDAAYTLHDLQGRLLASGTLRPGSQALPVADLARGVYVLRVHNTQFNSTHRISLQH